MHRPPCCYMLLAPTHHPARRANTLLEFPAPTPRTCLLCLQETAASSRMIKRVKAKEQALRMEGMSGAQASKVAAGLVTGVKRKKKGKEGGGSGQRAARQREGQ